MYDVPSNKGVRKRMIHDQLALPNHEHQLRWWRKELDKMRHHHAIVQGAKVQMKCSTQWNANISINRWSITSILFNIFLQCNYTRWDASLSVNGCGINLILFRIFLLCNPNIISYTQLHYHFLNHLHFSIIDNMPK